MILLYAILLDPDNQAQLMATGQSGGATGPLESIHTRGITALFSTTDQSGSGKRELGHLLHFHEVIETFFLSYPLIPMRYGSFVSGEEPLRAFLERAYPAILSLLHDLKDCVEMGISLQVRPTSKESRKAKNPTRRQPSAAVESVPEHSPVATQGAGRSYLTKRREEYFGRAQEREQLKTLMDEMCGLFEDISFRSKRECGSDRTINDLVQDAVTPAASLFFLIPKTNIEIFRDRFQQHYSDGNGATLSGPWPPYNFVSLQL